MICEVQKFNVSKKFKKFDDFFELKITDFFLSLQKIRFILLKFLDYL